MTRIHNQFTPIEKEAGKKASLTKKSGSGRTFLRLFSGFLLLFLFSERVAAETTTVPHTFSASRPASARRLNANFRALVAAINRLDADLDARLDALDVRLDELDARTGGAGGTLNSADLAGTYTLKGIEFLQSAYAGNPPPPTSLSETMAAQGTISGTVTLQSDGTFVAFHDHTISTLKTSVSTAAASGGTSPAIIVSQDVPSIATLSPSGRNEGTWSLSGQTLTLEYGGDPIAFVASGGGNLFFGVGKGFGLPGMGPHVGPPQDVKISTALFLIKN